MPVYASGLFLHAPLGLESIYIYSMINPFFFPVQELNSYSEANRASGYEPGERDEMRESIPTLEEKDPETQDRFSSSPKEKGE